MSQQILENAEILSRELDWLQQCIEARLKLYFELPAPVSSLQELPPPDLSAEPGNYAQFVQEHALNAMERLVLILTLAPHLKPEVLDGFFAKNQTYDRNFTEFGGQRGKVHGGFLPTGETALFLCGANNLRVRHLLHYLFSGDYLFARLNVLHLEVAEKQEPRFAGLLQISKEYLAYFLHGGILKPEFGPDFPARYVSTGLDWEELVLPQRTMEAVLEIRDWLIHSEKLLKDYDLGRRLSPGYKVLLHGPPGTGKTLTASLLGKVTDRDVYRIDLSLIVSKYIGETEKNLAKVFDQAQNQDWILFFDEADALFGRRTEARSSNDRFANQEVAYLLQRIEDFPGVAILASNLK
ncbi:MAG: ATP-binding protein, partial [Bacteroidota bacterium]